MAAHSWTQSESEVVVQVPVDISIGKDRLKVKIETAYLSVTAAGSSIFAKDLSGRVVPDDSYWSLESSGSGRHVVITLAKKKAGQWKTLTKEEEEVLPEPNVLDENFDVLNLEHDDDDPERVEEQEENERKLEARYKKLVEEKGLEDESTLQTFFALFDNCIQLYRLNKLSDYLEEVVPVCRKRDDKYKLKAVQALAFVRWKQSRFREALPLFHEMEQILGKGAALCENIAHTYNSLGDYDKAEDYFRQALKFIEQEHGMNKGNRGGVLLGLGLVRDRLGKHAEALPVVTKAYEFYKERANGAPASLQAKAGISCAKLHAKLGNLPKAETYIREAVHMYEVTCGETSPLTASAYHELGKCLWAQRKREDAQKALKRAYELEAMKDAWDLVTLLEIHNLLMDTHLKETDQIDRSKFEEYFKTADFIANRVRRHLPQDGNAAVYYKAAGELKAWGGSYAESKKLFLEAIPLLEAEKSTDCTGLVSSCKEMLAFCDRNLAGMQDSPMKFEIPDRQTKAAAGTSDNEDRMTSGVQIEELPDDSAEVPRSTPSASSTAPPPAVSSKTTPSAPAGTSRGQNSAPAAETPCIFRPAEPRDCGPALIILCATSGCEPVFDTEARFAGHLAGPGEGLCWTAEGPLGLQGIALCGSDGVYGHVLQLLPPYDSSSSSSKVLRRELLERCAGSCKSRGLRGMRVAVPPDGEDSVLYKELGWSASHTVYSQSFLSPKGSGTSASSSAGGVSTAASGPKPSAKLRRDGEDTGKYYEAWDKLNVEKALVEEEGLDPAIVPEKVPALEDFGQPQKLDVAWKISRYSWDQSRQSVSIYVPFDGVGSLPAGSVETIFKPRGVLLLIHAGGKQHWYKVPNLCHTIDTEASKSNVKADQVVLKLRKAAQGEEWSDLTDEKDRFKQQREYRIQHGDLKDATTEQLLADMYKNATDEERAGLRDAMRINREKRAEEAKRAAGS